MHAHGRTCDMCMVRWALPPGLYAGAMEKFLETRPDQLSAQWLPTRMQEVGYKTYMIGKVGVRTSSEPLAAGV